MQLLMSHYIYGLFAIGMLCFSLHARVWEVTDIFISQIFISWNLKYRMGIHEASIPEPLVTCPCFSWVGFEWLHQQWWLCWQLLDSICNYSVLRSLNICENFMFEWLNCTRWNWCQQLVSLFEWLNCSMSAISGILGLKWEWTGWGPLDLMWKRRLELIGGITSPLGNCVHLSIFFTMPFFNWLSLIRFSTI